MAEAVLTAQDYDRSFLAEVEKLSGQNVRLCYVCGKCSAGCPQALDMPLLPHQIMLMIQTGWRQPVLSSATPWMCASCGTCSTRCPKDIDINAIMDTLNEMAGKADIDIRPKIRVFRQEFLSSIAKHGRLYELGMALKLNLRKGELLSDADMGFNLWRKGKIHLKSPSAMNKSRWAKIFKRENR